jgi:penicillin-binding protein 1C
VQLDISGQFRVNSSCVDLSTTNSKSWFSLPPLMEFYYKRTHPIYKSLPPFRNDCVSTNDSPMEFIYPKNESRISLTKNFEGKQNEVVLKLSHTKPETQVYWYLDDLFISQTKYFHEIGLIPGLGKHKITVVDALGNEVNVRITIE